MTDKIPSDIIIEHLTPIDLVDKDLLKALRDGPGGVTDNEARFLVDFYYLVQKQRIRLNNQVKGLVRDAKKNDVDPEPHALLSWTFDQFLVLEKQVKKMLTIYTSIHDMEWFFEQTLGIGPVLSAGLLAHIDITRAPTVGHIWRYAGLDPTSKWEKGQKRPWNASLKTLCWKIGESFAMNHKREGAVYGRIYSERKLLEQERNERGDFEAQAREKLERFNIGKDTDAYAAYSIGKLPPAHIDQRAKRYAVKFFLSHLQYRWWEQVMGEKPPKPYVVEHLGHAHFIEPPQIPPVKKNAA